MQNFKQQFVALVRKLQRKNLPQFPVKLSTQAIFDWANTSGIAEIAAELHCESDDHRSLREMYRLIVRSSNAKNAADFKKQVAAWLGLQEQAGRSRNKALPKLKSSIENKVRNLPRDAFYFSHIDHQRSGGFIAYLRLVRELTAGSIAVRPLELLDEGVSGRRVARLRSPYIYRLTQQLAEVFASIGLPEVYENERMSSVGNIELQGV